MNKFRDNYVPDQNIAVDEYLSLWKGRLSFRICLPTKREFYGIKLFMLCESTTAYLSSIIIYTGRSTDYGTLTDDNLPKDWNEYKTASQIVLSLAKPFLKKRQLLYVT